MCVLYALSTLLPQALLLNITDDTEPELVETFVVSLEGVTVAGNDKLTTTNSGAIINTNASQFVVNVEESDDPYGLIQFWTEATLPSTTIPPLTEQPEVSVLEEDGLVELTVVRAQGLLGDVSVEYQTINGNGTDGVDYTSVGGTLMFVDGERVKTIQVPIIDDATPELGRQFFAELVNPTGGESGTEIRVYISPNLVWVHLGGLHGSSSFCSQLVLYSLLHHVLLVPPDPMVPSLGPGSRIGINILPSDSAFGVFAFSAGSRSTVAQESAGSVTLAVERMGGALGVVSVYWEVEGAATEDISPSSSVVVFAEGETTAAIVLTILNDTVRMTTLT